MGWQACPQLLARVHGGPAAAREAASYTCRGRVCLVGFRPEKRKEVQAWCGGQVASRERWAEQWQGLSPLKALVDTGLCLWGVMAAALQRCMWLHYAICDLTTDGGYLADI